MFRDLWQAPLSRPLLSRPSQPCYSPQWSRALRSAWARKRSRIKQLHCGFLCSVWFQYTLVKFMRKYCSQIPCAISPGSRSCRAGQSAETARRAGKESSWARAQRTGAAEQRASYRYCVQPLEQAWRLIWRYKSADITPPCCIINHPYFALFYLQAKRTTGLRCLKYFP